MAKKKELPKAMMGKIIKPMVRAISAGSKVVKHTKPKTTDIIGNAVKAGKTGYSREVATYKKAQEAKKAAKAPIISEEKKLMNELNKQKKNAETVSKPVKPTLKQKAKNVKSKVSNLTPKQKLAIGAGTAIAVGTYKYLNRERRTLKD